MPVELPHQDRQSRPAIKRHDSSRTSATGLISIASRSLTSIVEHEPGLGRVTSSRRGASADAPPAIERKSMSDSTSNTYPGDGNELPPISKPQSGLVAGRPVSPGLRRHRPQRHARTEGLLHLRLRRADRRSLSAADARPRPLPDDQPLPPGPLARRRRRSEHLDGLADERPRPPPPPTLPFWRLRLAGPVQSV